VVLGLVEQLEAFLADVEGNGDGLARPNALALAGDHGLAIPQGNCAFAERSKGAAQLEMCRVLAETNP